MSDTPNAAVKRRLIGGDDGRLTKRQKGGHGAPISSEVAISQEQACNASSSRKASPMPSGHQDSPSSMQRCEKAEETKDTDSGNTKTIDSGVEGRQEKINLKLFSVPFRDRVKAYHILYDCKSQDEHRNMMIEVRKIGEEVYAQTLHDSPAKFRQVQLTKDLEENSDSDMHRRLIRNITELSVQRDIADPCQIIPPGSH
ncbi:hypothetical protein FoTM2_017694 [Fusarium oxysporum f. sp. vasinfectum]|nr:hypothetical protein FoTM2_017694 [Fusarium oxysporum f. sp. vasinfectum]